MRHVYPIAKNTFREAVRDRILYVILLFAALLMMAGVGLGWVSVGEELQVVQHFSLAGLSFFGALLAVFVGAGLVHKELEKRTVYTILSKPVRRWEFILGKYLGLGAALAVAMFGMGIAAMVFVAWSAWTATIGTAAEIPDWTARVHWMLFLQAVVLAYVETMVVTAIAVLFSAAASPTLSAVFTFCIYLLGQVSRTLDYMITEFMPATESVSAVTGENLTDAVSRTYWLVKPVSVFLYYVLPDMRYFQLRNNVVYGPAPTAAEFFGAILYGAGYAAAVLLVAAIVFERKKF